MFLFVCSHNDFEFSQNPLYFAQLVINSLNNQKISEIMRITTN